MKGITPVIAIILLLLLTISMVGFAFVWFNRVVSQSGTQIEQETSAELNKQGQRIRIDNVDPATLTVTIRHTGTVTIPGGSLALYKNNVAVACGWTSLAPGATQDCTPVGQSCVDGTDRIKVTAPGGPDEVTC